MLVCKRAFAFLAVMVLCIATASAQQGSSEGGAASRNVHLNVVVTTASGQCVTDLQQKDFKILDNNLPQPITSFRTVTISPREIEVPGRDHSPSFRTATSPTQVEVPDSRAYSTGDGANTGCYEQGELFQYEITFNVPSDARPNEYHGVEVKVYKPNLIIRTRRGYFTQP
jgi:hypothetical protein